MSLRDRLWGAFFRADASAGADLRRQIPRAIREARAVDRRTVGIPAVGTERGRVLLAYILAGFDRGEDGAFMASHTHYWEAVDMARAWSEAGFRVDVIDNYNLTYRPRGTYDVIIGARMILEPLANRATGDPLKIFHVDTSHWLASNAAQLERLRGIQERRGESLKPRKLIEVNRAAEVADVATVLGNDYTMGTYAYRRLPMHRVPISSVVTRPWIDRDMDSARRSFVWLGSQGLVHKGLDLVLEAFAGMPDLELHVCGPIHEERDFIQTYEKELHHLPNIHPVGWVDVRGPEWKAIAARSVGIVYPSCAEGGGGSVIACMHDGLIPIVTASASVDVSSDSGVVVAEATVSSVQDAVRSVAERSPECLARLSRGAWEAARKVHTREHFAARYRELVPRLLDAGGG